MALLEGDLTVGADPATCVVILQFANADDFANVVLTPEKAELLASALRTAADHIRSQSGRKLDAIKVQARRGSAAVRVESGSPEMMLLVSDSARERLVDLRVAAHVAQQNAAWLEQAAAAMRAQRSGGIDQRVVFNGQEVGQA